MPDSRADGPGPVSVLRRAVGTPAAVATSAGLAFAAIDFLGVVSVATYAAGSSAWIAILAGGLLVLLVSGIFSELNGLFPTAAGIRLYIGRAMGTRVSLTVGFTYMTTVVLVIAADAFLIGSAINHVLHESAWFGYVWIAVLLGIAVGANLRGIRMASSVQVIVTYTILASTTVLSVIAIFHVGRGFPHPFGLFGHGDFGAVQSIAFSLFLYAAFEWVTTTAEEARRPQVITRALFIAPVLICITATTFALGLAQLVPFGQLHGSAFPQLLLGSATLGTVGELWMFAVTLLTALNTFNGGFLVASRFMYAAAREGSLPRQFARLNMKAVPWLSVVALAVTSALVAALVFATHQWLLLVAVGATIEAGIYSVAAWCLLVLRRREHRERPFRLVAAKPLASIGVVLFGALALASGLSDPKNAHHFSVLPISVIVVVAAVSGSYVRFVLPRLQAKAALRSSASRPKRRPARPGTSGGDQPAPDGL